MKKLENIISPVRDLITDQLKICLTDIYAGFPIESGDSLESGYIEAIEDGTWKILRNTILNSFGIPQNVFDDYIIRSNESSAVKLLIPNTKGKSTAQLAKIWIQIEVVIRNYISKKKDWTGTYLIRYEWHPGSIKYVLNDAGTPRIFTWEEAVLFCKNGSSKYRIVPNMVDFHNGRSIKVTEYKVESKLWTIMRDENSTPWAVDEDGHRIELQDILYKFKYKLN
jgi:hypothetical protein